MTISARAATILKDLPRIRGWQEALYRDLHQHPELSDQEHRTAGIVADQLREWGYEVLSGVGGTGVVGLLRSGDGPTVLLRADMDALPVQEATGLPYASVVRATDAEGNDVPVMHACGHDAHVTCLLGAAALLARNPEQWNGTVIALFSRPKNWAAERPAWWKTVWSTGGCGPGTARRSVAGGAGRYPTWARHGLSGQPAGYGLWPRFHESMPHNAIDPVVLAAMIVLRLQTIVSREVDPSQTAVVTVGSIHAGTKGNVICDHAVLEINVRSYDDEVRATVLDAIRRIVVAECHASGCSCNPDIEIYGRLSVTVNDDETTSRVTGVFTEFFGNQFFLIPPVKASEDFGDIANALGAPYTYWFFGGANADQFAQALAAGRVSQDIPVNHAPNFAPIMQPTFDTGTQALVVAALAWL